MKSNLLDHQPKIVDLDRRCVYNYLKKKKVFGIKVQVARFVCSRLFDSG